MHHALTTIIVAASVIAIVGGAAAGIYHYIAQLPEAPVSALQGKAAEIGYFLSASQDGTVHGVPTGRCTMSSVSLDPFNVTLALPEGPSSFPANKTALAVQGIAFSAPPSANYSQGGGARIFSSGNTTYIMLLMRLVSVATETEREGAGHDRPPRHALRPLDPAGLLRIRYLQHDEEDARDRPG
jgi:hypothetical protein